MTQRLLSINAGSWTLMANQSNHVDLTCHNKTQEAPTSLPGVLSHVQPDAQMNV